MKRLIGGLLCLMALAPSAWAQISTGNIYGKVTDESGGVLPGVTVTISSGMATRSTMSGNQGDFRFLNLDPATYKLSVSLTGFSTANREVVVNAGSNVDLTFGLKVGSLSDQITVVGETPTVDMKRVGTSTTLTKEELSQTPQSRDPWSVLKTVPGVLVDRVSIAGNEAGQQSVFTAKGASNADTQYTMDGVVITDSACGGCSSMYYDFDAFDEIKVDTGGNDLKVMSGGVGLNFVVKRGSNAFHGSAHDYFSHHKLESVNTPSDLRTDDRIAVPGNPDLFADRIQQISDFGVDLGGPIVKDKLWFWAAYNRNDIRLVRISQTADKTLLNNYNAKVNWQASSNDMVSLFFFNGVKEKFGRSPGYAGNEPDSLLFDQGSFYADFGPFQPLHGLFKLEDNHVFSPNFFVNVKYGYFGWGYGFDPRGGTQTSGGIDLTTDTGYGSSLTYRSLRPWHVGDVSANYFKTALGGQHELKFGFGYRYNPVHSTTSYAGGGVVAHKNADDDSKAFIYKDRVAHFVGKNLDVFLGDTFTKGRFTLNIGARFDRQQANNEASTSPANTLFPDILPAVTVDPSKLVGIDWKDVSPRVAVNYALDESRKTVVRASYARYAGQLNSFESTTTNAAGVYYPYLAFNWVDLNGNHLAEKNEILVNEGVQYSNGINPANPGSNDPPNLIDPDYKANHDSEYIVGLDRELFPNFAVSAAFTHRKTTDVPSWNPRIDASGRILAQTDYTPNAPVTITTPEGSFTAQSFSPNPDLVTGQRMLTNRPDYHTSFNGIELSANKRLSNKWMMRAAFSYNDWTEHFDGPGAKQNPTRTQNTAGGTQSGPGVEGGQVTVKSYGSKTDTFFNSKWQFSASGLYELPAGFEVAASVFGRQGYPRAIIMRLPAGADGRPRIVATPEIDSLRFSNLWNLDLRLAKNLKLGSNVSLGLAADVFNVLNNDVVLQRSRQVNADAFARVNEIINPRVARIGVRLGF